MEFKHKLRELREAKNWSQEEMAEKLGMSVTGYGKIERGDTKLQFEKMVQIAKVLNVGILDLVEFDEPKFIWNVGENNTTGDNNITYYGDQSAVICELEKQKLINEHSQELLAQKEREIETLREMIALLKTK